MNEGMNERMTFLLLHPSFNDNNIINKNFSYRMLFADVY